MDSLEKPKLPEIRELTPAEERQLRALGEAMVQQAGLARFITDAERAELLFTPEPRSSPFAPYND